MKQRSWDRELYPALVVTLAAGLSVFLIWRFCMAYTAAALSYLIQGSPKPIVLTGAQKPIGFDVTDSKVNLTDAFRVASADMPGVSLVFNGKVILGTRAQKVRSKSFEAFSSINYPFLGVLRDGVLLPYIRQDCKDRPSFYEDLNTSVALLKLIPGTDQALLDYLLERNDALIIESFGVGGLPDYEGADFCGSVCRWTAKGKLVVLTTQVQNEGSDLGIYHGICIQIKKCSLFRYFTILSGGKQPIRHIPELLRRQIWPLPRPPDCTADT